jgi:hypothetical protein
MNLDETEKHLEKVFIYIGESTITHPKENCKYQVCMMQKLQSQLSEYEELPGDINDSISMLIDNTVYPATFERNKIFKSKYGKNSKYTKPAKFMTMSSYHTFKVKLF